MKKMLTAAILLSLSATAVAAESADTVQSASAEAREGSRHGLGVRLGTDGIGLSYTYGLHKYVDVRAAYTFGSLSYDAVDEDEGVAYGGELKFGAVSALVDIKPFGGGFRVTTGVYSAPPELTVGASGYDEYEIGDGETYTGNVSLDGGIDLGSTAPYLGLGWGGTSNGKGLGVSFDVGVLFTKSPKVSLRASGNDITDANGNSFDIGDGSVSDQEFQAALRTEIADLEEDAKEFKLWPVLNLGLHYRF